MSDKVNPLIGRTVKDVALATDGGAIQFTLDDGTTIIARADGDCCSHTWIAEVQGVDQILDSRIVAVEEVGSTRVNEGEQGDTVIAFYGCKITSEKGYALLDYRNESNGYYGGNLAWPGDYFYGGVHNQNVSTDEWRSLTSSEQSA